MRSNTRVLMLKLQNLFFYFIPSLTWSEPALPFQTRMKGSSIRSGGCLHLDFSLSLHFQCKLLFCKPSNSPASQTAKFEGVKHDADNPTHARDNHVLAPNTYRTDVLHGCCHVLHSSQTNTVDGELFDLSGCTPLLLAIMLASRYLRTDCTAPFNCTLHTRFAASPRSTFKWRCDHGFQCTPLAKATYNEVEPATSTIASVPTIPTSPTLGVAAAARPAPRWTLLEAVAYKWTPAFSAISRHTGVGTDGVAEKTTLWVGI